MNLKESNRRFLSEKALGRVMVLLDGDIIIKRNKQRRNHTKRNRRNEKNGLKVRLCSGWRWTKRNKGTDKQQSVWEEKFLVFVLRRIINPFTLPFNALLDLPFTLMEYLRFHSVMGRSHPFDLHFSIEFPFEPSFWRSWRLSFVCCWALKSSLKDF